MIKSSTDTQINTDITNEFRDEIRGICVIRASVNIMKILAKNRRAYFDYEITDKLEAGIVLSGQEVKSAKTGGVSLDGSYARVSRGQASLINAHIKAYQHASNLEGYDPTQTRRLLLHKREIGKLENKTSEKGLTLIPLEIYVKKGYIKVRLGLGRAKKKTDKREMIKKRESDRKIQRAIRKSRIKK